MLSCKTASSILCPCLPGDDAGGNGWVVALSWIHLVISKAFLPTAARPCSKKARSCIFLVVLRVQAVQQAQRCRAHLIQQAARGAGVPLNDALVLQLDVGDLAGIGLDQSQLTLGHLLARLVMSFIRVFR